MSDRAEDDIDALLRERFEGPVPAGDFCDQVMAQLSPRRRRTQWPVAAGLIAGTAVCCLSLAAAPLARTGWRDWLSGEASVPAMIVLLAVAGSGILASIWAITEAADRQDGLRRAASSPPPAPASSARPQRS